MRSVIAQQERCLSRSRAVAGNAPDSVTAGRQKYHSAHQRQQKRRDQQDVLRRGNLLPAVSVVGTARARRWRARAV
jgi:hypothetical protein